MKSIRKSQNDLVKYANKENESVNGKRTQVTKSSSSVDSSFNWAKRHAIDQQRKLRLIEVRQQSKEIASKIRENVREEEARQLEIINRIQKDELFKWRQKQINNTEEQYSKCLEEIGQAHLAAERENAKEKQFELQKAKNRQMALKRGKIAEEKLKEEKNMKPTKGVVTIKPKKVVMVAPKIDRSPESTSDTSTSSSSDSSVCSVIQLDKKKKTEKDVKTVYPYKITPKKSSAKSPAKTSIYNPMRYASGNSSAATDVSLTDSPSLSDTPPLITKVSELLGKKPTTKSNASLRSSPHIAKTYKLDKSPVSLRNIPKKVSQKPQLNAVSSRLSRVIKTPTKATGKSPMKTLPDRKHYVPEFVKSKESSKQEESANITPTRTSKVRFYDHANRYWKEYDGHVDLIERVNNVIPLSAWEEARTHTCSERDIQANESLNFKKLAENRSKVALEKEKIRRDYDQLSSQLSDILKNNELANSFLQSNEMLSQSRLKEIAEEKQRLMNTKFRGSLKSSSLITCPKVTPKASASDQRPKAGDLNVAKKKSALKSTQVQDDASSDSTHSFLLDYVNERSNIISDDINRCRNERKTTNHTKIKALRDLMENVNSFRRILQREIEENNGDLSHINTSQFLTEFEKVEEKRTEIMNEKSAAKKEKSQPAHKWDEDLTERERLLKLKESCIEEKARELYLREKQIKQHKEQVKKVSDKPSTSKGGILKKPIAVETTNGADSDDIPVRIVINVNKTDLNEEKSTEVIVNDVKWRDKLRKSAQLKENVKIVPVTNAPGKSYPKTPTAKPKLDVVERKQLDISSQSSTSITSYLDIPDHIKSQLSKAFQPSAICSKENAQPSGQSMSDTDLLHYIIRMMGMSRTSIEQLNISSVSSIRTPNSSIINVTNNRQVISSTTSTPASNRSSISLEQNQPIDNGKLEQIARFLAQNNQLCTKKRKDSKESGVSSSVWDDILSRKYDGSSKSEITERNKPKQIKSRESVPEETDEQLSRDDFIAKYDKMAANCTKRIINLDSMISKVREEKQKLMENTISSASSLMTAQKETEYMEYPGPNHPVQESQQPNNNTASSMSDSKGTNAPSDFSSTSGTGESSVPIENRTGLLASKHKPLGESKDSGVGISRPVTSSDYRESPDLRQNTKESDSNAKLLQNALRSSELEHLFKDIPKYIYQTAAGTITHQDILPHEQSPESNISRERSVKPPVAMARYSSPQMDDELPHELSTITEVDTPVTSRLNAVDVNNGNENSMKNLSAKLLSDKQIYAFLYNSFPDFKEYIAKNDMAQTSLVDEPANGGSVVLDERLSNLLESARSKISELKYKSFDGESQLPPIDSSILVPNDTCNNESKAVDREDFSVAHNAPETSDSDIPDIVHELKKRQIIAHSFSEGDGDGSDLDDLLNVYTKQKSLTTSKTTEENNSDGNLTDTLGRDLNQMGMGWARVEMNKTKAASASSSLSDSSNQADQPHQSSNKQVSPNKARSAKRSFQRMNQSKATEDSFVDKNLVVALASKKTTGSTQADSDTQAKSINLRSFLARELQKHSSMSSSDSSLASIHLKSYMDQLPETPLNRASSQHRTSTPVDQSSDSKVDLSTKKGQSLHRNISKSMCMSPSFFSNESQISSVHSSTQDSTPNSVAKDEKNKP